MKYLNFQERLYLIIIICFCGVILILDSVIPSGYHIGALYNLIIIPSSFLIGSKRTFIALVLFISFFILIGFHLSPKSDHLSYFFLNRVISVLVVVLVAMISWYNVVNLKLREEATKNLASIVDSAEDGIFSISLDGKITSWNLGAESIYQYFYEEIMNKPVLNLIDEKFHDDFQNCVSELKSGYIVRSFESVHLDSNQKPFHASATFSPIKNSKGDITSIALVVRDITHQKKLEAKLLSTNQELKQFAYIASHDLQEPLRKIKGFGNLLMEGYHDKLDEDGRMFIQKMDDASIRMSNLISALLKYSAIGSKEINFKPVNLTETMKAVLSDMEIIIDESKATIKFDDLPTISGDSILLQQLFKNLISNAIKYVKDKPPIVEISANRINGNQVRLIISDNGIGIDEKNIKKIFEPFKRLHSQKEYQGTGIGLAHCKKIVDKHHGKITVESKVGEGSRFIIDFFNG
jgi:PAS domain S-box-containing protein